MIADWTVEISSLSPSIDVPWSGWVDLHWNPHAPNPTPWKEEQATQLAEVQAYPELLKPLELINRLNCSTSKLDVFPVTAGEVDPEIAEAGETATRCGLGSYLDVLSVRGDIFNTFEKCADLARRTAKSLARLTDSGTCAEIVLRPASVDGRQTYGWTLYTMGFGPDEPAARATWAQALKLTITIFGFETCTMIFEDIHARYPHLGFPFDVLSTKPGE